MKHGSHRFLEWDETQWKRSQRYQSKGEYFQEKQAQRRQKAIEKHLAMVRRKRTQHEG